MYVPYGILPAIVTPMTDDEKIHEENLRKQVRRFLKTRVHGLFCLGTNGEFYVLSKEEKIQVMKAVVQEVNGKLPVCAGVGCITTAETVELAQAAQEAGVHAVSVITPFFGQVSDAALINHYKAVASSVDIGVILYNIPARTGCNISRQVVEKLASVNNIVGIKDSSGNFDTILQYLEVTGRQFPVLSGNDSLILYTLMAGGTGGVAGTANLFPNKIADIYNLYKQQKIDEARRIQDGIRPIRDCLRLGNPNSVIKRAVNLLGWDVGPVRKPFEGDYQQWDPILTDILKKHYRDWD